MAAELLPLSNSVELSSRNADIKCLNIYKVINRLTLTYVKKVEILRSTCPRRPSDLR